MRSEWREWLTPLLIIEHRHLWKEVKKIKGRNNVSPANVDGATNVDDILNTFSVKYRYLYNSVPYDNNRMSKIQQEINERLNLSNGILYYRR